MFDDLDLGFEIPLETLIPTIVIYVIVSVMMWFLLLHKSDGTLMYGWLGTIMFYVVLAPISYFIITHYQNKG